MGYRLDVWGRVPGLWPLTLRMRFPVFGPLNYLMDILWLSADAHRQALRDRFAQTDVDIFGYNFLFREIEEAVLHPAQERSDSVDAR